jgi:ABC-type dipeptide/oligopeptide/nickel transport system ATPase component
MTSFCVDNNVNPSKCNHPVILTRESEDILQKLKKVNSSYFFKPDNSLVRQLKVVDPVELTNVLKCFFLEMISEEQITDPVKFLDRLATIIPLAKLQEVVKGDMGDALEQAKGMFQEAKFYLEMTQRNISPGIRARISSILDGLVSVVECIITTFGVGALFKPAESDMDASFKTQQIMMLFSMFGMISTMILPLLGFSTGALVIGGILLSIAAISVVWPFIKPMPFHLPANAENLTKQAQNGCFVAQGRKKSLDEIADILKMNRHAILVGPSRVGKSLTARAFAQAVERGDYPELKGKVVFRINTADIIDPPTSPGASSMLNKIREAMGRHRGNIILVFDEIHMACKHKEKIADQLKTLLDEGGEFPHVIGITTKEEYEHVKNNNAFALRFDKVDIDNTSPDETMRILGDTVLKSHPKPLIKEGAFDYIYDKSCEGENAPQPTASLKLLKRCITRTEKTQISPTGRKIIEVSNKILSLRSQAAASRGRKKEANVQIAQLEKQLKELQGALSVEQKNLNKLFKSKDLLDRVTQETYSFVLKIATIAQKKLNTNSEKQLKLFILLHEFLGRSLESHIEKTAKALGVRAVIDKNLIDEVATA